jgi:hypothetical protein
MESKIYAGGGYRRGTLKTTIVYCGKKKNDDKFMGDWNNNGRYLGWTPGQAEYLLYLSI